MSRPTHFLPRRVQIPSLSHHQRLQTRSVSLSRLLRRWRHQRRLQTTPPASTAEQIAELPKTFAETLTLNNPQLTAVPPPPAEPWPSEPEQPPAYPIRWLSEAEYETLDPRRCRSRLLK